MKKVKLSLETAKKMYNSIDESVRAFALENFTKEELESKIYPENWGEVIKITTPVFYLSTLGDISDTKNYITRNHLNTKEQAKAVLAICQLTVIRDAYIGDWVPNWNDIDVKYCVLFIRNQPKIIKNLIERRFLLFPTQEMAEHFLKHHIELINQAKYYL